MGHFTHLAQKRRSIRRFTDEPLSSEQVVALMRVALLSPSSRGRCPWEFMLVDQRELLHQLSECKPHGGQMIERAALAVVILGKPEESDVWVEDCSVAATMLLLQAEDLGLGACWVQVRLRTQEDGTPSADYVKEILGIPPTFDVHSIIAIGHKGIELPEHGEEDLQWEKVHFNTYGVQ